MSYPQIVDGNKLGGYSHVQWHRRKGLLLAVLIGVRTDLVNCGR